MINITSPEIVIKSESESDATDILRCLSTLYSTVSGEQAMDRDFGIDPSILDMPERSAKALYTAEVTEKTTTYEPRAQVTKVEWVADDAGAGCLKPKVVIEIVEH